MKYYLPVIIMLSVLTTSCTKQLPIHEEYYENAEFLYTIKITREARRVRLSGYDGMINVSMFGPSKDKHTEFHLQLGDSMVNAFTEIVEKQLTPSALFKGDSNGTYEVQFSMIDPHDEMSGTYQSNADFRQISPEFVKLVEIIDENKQIRNFLDNGNTK